MNNTDSGLSVGCPQCGEPDDIQIRRGGVHYFHFATMSCRCGYGECAPYDMWDPSQPELQRRFYSKQSHHNPIGAPTNE